MKSTRFALEQALAMHKKTPLSRHLEIETYTWDVLPDHLKTGEHTTAQEREQTFPQMVEIALDAAIA